MCVEFWYNIFMNLKVTKRVVPVGVLAALLMGFVLLLEGALMSGILENHSSGLIQFVPGFAAWVEKEGVMKESVQVPLGKITEAEGDLEILQGLHLQTQLCGVIFS